LILRDVIAEEETRKKFEKLGRDDADVGIFKLPVDDSPSAGTYQRQLLMSALNSSYIIAHGKRLERIARLKEK
jgi:hypothetical protein